MNPSVPKYLITRLSIPGMVSVALFLLFAYYFTAKLGLALASVDRTVTLIWAPSGIAMAILFRFGIRYAPMVLLASFAVNLQEQFWRVALGIALGSTAATSLGALGWRSQRLSPSFDHWRDTQTILIVAALATSLSALNGTLWLYGGGKIDASR